MKKKLVVVLGIAVLVLGAGCLNYTNTWGYEHHLEWSQANGMPEPSVPIFYFGVAATALGGFVLGLAFRRLRR